MLEYLKKNPKQIDLQNKSNLVSVAQTTILEKNLPPCNENVYDVIKTDIKQLQIHV